MTKPVLGGAGFAGGRLVEPAGYVQAADPQGAVLPASGNNSATFKIDIALSGLATYHQGAQQRRRIDDFDIRKTALMTGTFDDNFRQLQAIRAGDSLENPPVYMAVLTANDASLAPDGQDVVYLASNVPAQPRDGWDKAKPPVRRSHHAVGERPPRWTRNRNRPNPNQPSRFR